MYDAAFGLAATLYAVSGVMLLLQLARGPTIAVTRLGPWVLLAAAAVHLGLDVRYWLTPGGGPFAGIRPSLSTLALLGAGGYFALRQARPRFDVVGAFVAPLALFMLLASRHSNDTTAAPLGALTVLHVASVIIGTGAFTVAFAVALAYLLQERQVKQKRLRGLFQRLPPLDVLDEVGFRFVAVGLPVLTLGVVTGLMVIARTAARAASFETWQRTVGLAVWVLFAGVLGLRIVAGWRGRRPAIGTVLGYAGVIAVLVGYYLRGLHA
ncbi:MAG: cytochrome c biogenesis protein CcsA [Myxococcales bacterium]|nr:cytochrome c biogenesis protein CcsA [Myxococcales bacterium]